MAKTDTKTTQAPALEATAPFQPEARAYPIENPKGSVIAFASIAITEDIAARNIKVVNGRNGVFVAMPGDKGADGKYYDNVYAYTAEGRVKLHQMVLDAYVKAAEKDHPELAAAAKKARDELGKPSLTGRIREAAKDTKNSPVADKDIAAPAQEAR